jgi:hypothetical protein
VGCNSFKVLAHGSQIFGRCERPRRCNACARSEIDGSCTCPTGRSCDPLSRPMGKSIREDVSSTWCCAVGKGRGRQQDAMDHGRSAQAPQVALRANDRGPSAPRDSELLRTSFLSFQSPRQNRELCSTVERKRLSTARAASAVGGGQGRERR